MTETVTVWDGFDIESLQGGGARTWWANTAKWPRASSGTGDATIGLGYTLKTV